ncbi:MAG: putative Ig domain-containing protein [Verrucomicrobiales bacterium]
MIGVVRKEVDPAKSYTVIARAYQADANNEIFAYNYTIGTLGASDQTVAGTLMFDEDIDYPAGIASANVSVPPGLSFDLSDTASSGSVYVGGAGELSLSRITAPSIVLAGGFPGEITDSKTSDFEFREAGVGTVSGCLFLGEAQIGTTFGRLTVSGNDFYGRTSTITCPKDGVAVTGNACPYGLGLHLPDLADGDSLAGKVSGNSFIGGLGFLKQFPPPAPPWPTSYSPGIVDVSGNYWAGFNGPANAIPHGGWLDGTGSGCGAGFPPNFSWLTSGFARATSLEADIPLSTIGSDYLAVQNVSGWPAIIRKGRSVLIAVDARTRYGTRSGGDLRLAVTGGPTLAPINAPTITMDPGDPKNFTTNRTVNFVIPASEADRVEFSIIDTGKDDQTVTYGSYGQRGRPARPLRLAVVPLEIEGYAKSGFRNARPGKLAVNAVRKHIAARLPLREDEIEIDQLPAAKYKLGYTALYALLSRTYMLNEAALVLTGHLNRLNAQRPDHPYDFLIAVVPQDTLGSGNYGVSLALRRKVILVDEISPESAVHELGHGLGLYTLGEQYNLYLGDGYRGDGIYYKDGYGARVEGCTGYIPQDAARVSPLGSGIRHFPAGVDTGVYDVMGGSGTQWIIGQTQYQFAERLYQLLGEQSSAAPLLGKAGDAAGKKPVGKSPPAPGMRRVLLQGLINVGQEEQGFVRESLRCAIAPPDLDPIAGSFQFPGHVFKAYDAGGNQVFSQTCSRSPDSLQYMVQTFDVPESAARYELSESDPDYFYTPVTLIQKPVAGMGISLAGPPAGVLPQSFSLSWTTTGSLADGRPLPVELFWSTDGGATWELAGDFTEQTSATFEAGFAPAGSSLVFKAAVSDGFSTQVSTRGGYTVPYPPFEAIIASPWDGASAPEESAWTLVAESSDPDAPATFTWESSLDGPLGSGAQVSAPLSLGTHVITLSGTTTGGRSDTSQITVAVRDPELKQFDAAVAADAFSLQVEGVDPVQGVPDRPIAGHRCTVRTRFDNPGVPGIARARLYVTKPGAPEQLLADQEISWGLFEQRELTGDFTAAGAGNYLFRAALEVLEPSDHTDVNPANNQRTWLTENARPEARALRGVAAEGEAIPFYLFADDLEGDAVTLQITAQPQHGTLGGSIPNLTYTPAPGFTGADSFRYRASDALGAGPEAEASALVLMAVPKLTSANSIEPEQFHPFDYAIAASGTGATATAADIPLVFEDNLEFYQGTQILSGQFNTVTSGGVALTIENAAGRVKPILEIDVQPNDDLSQITSPLTIDTTAGTEYWMAYNLTATYFPTGYEYVGLPDGLGYSPFSGQLTGYVAHAGFYPVQVGVTNNAGTSWTTLTIRAAANPNPPDFPPMSAFGMVGQPFSYRIPATNDPFLFEALSLPIGLHLNTQTGLITGTPEQAGSVFATVTATNLFGSGSDFISFYFDVPAGFPQLNNPGGIAATGGAPFSITLTATNGPVTFSATGLPDGLSLHPTSGVLSGTPREWGQFRPVVRVTNGAGATASTLDLWVNPGGSWPIITSDLYLERTIGQSFTYTFTANNATTYSAGSLPAGLSYNASTRRITGTLQIPGRHNISLMASNASGETTGTLVLVVANTFSGWADLHQLAGADRLPDADTDRDGAMNIAEFAGNSDPRSAASKPFVQIAREGNVPVLRFRTWPAESGMPQGTFAAAGITIRVLTAGDLGGGWATDPSIFLAGSVTPMPDGTAIYTLPIMPDPAFARRFFSLGFD